MLLDTLSMFSDGQSLSGSTIDSTVLDVKGAGIAEAESFIAIRFDTASHGCTNVALKGCEDNSTWKNIVSVDVNDSTEGAGVNIRVPQGCPRYMKLVYTGTSMRGTVKAGVTLRAPSPRGKRIGDYAAN